MVLNRSGVYIVYNNRNDNIFLRVTRILLSIILCIVCTAIVYYVYYIIILALKILCYTLVRL